jgi:hypothetical protein
MCKYCDLRQCQLTYDVGEITNIILLNATTFQESLMCGSLLTNRATARTNSTAIKLPRIENEHLRIVMKIARSSVRIIHRLSFSLFCFCMPPF